MKGTYRIYAQRRFAPFDWEMVASTDNAWKDRPCMSRGVWRSTRWTTVVAPVGSQHRENVGPGESATETRRIDEREESQ